MSRQLYGRATYSDGSTVDIMSPIETDTGILLSSDIQQLEQQVSENPPEYDCPIILSENTKHIGDYAFDVDHFGHVSNYRIASIPQSLESIGRYAFNKCAVILKDIQQLDLPECSSIGERAFFGATVNGIDAPALTVIEPYSFYSINVNNNTPSAEFNFPNVTQVGYCAFKNANIYDISLPSVRYDEGSTFTHSNLTSLSLPNLKYSEGDQGEMNSLLKLSIPSLKEVRWFANSCARLSSVEIAVGCQTYLSFNRTPSKIVKVTSSTGNNVPQSIYIQSCFNNRLSGNSSLLTYDGSLSVDDGYVEFDLANSTSKIFFHDSFTDGVVHCPIFAQTSSFDGCEVYESFNNITGFGSFGPEYTSKLSSRDIFASATVLDNSFNNISGETQIDITLPAIRTFNHSFEDNNVVSSLTFGDNVYDVKLDATRTSSLKKIRFPDSQKSRVYSMDDYPFGVNPDCIEWGRNQWLAISRSLSKGEINAEYVNQLMTDCHLIPEYTSRVDFCNREFRAKRYSLEQLSDTLECVNFTNVNVDNYYRAVDPYMFAWYRSLVTVTGLDTLCEIPESMFEQCTALRNVNLDLLNVTIGKFAFSSCTRLRQFDIIRASSIGDYAFYNCTGLEVPIIKGAIHQYAFAHCSSLKNVQTDGSVDSFAFEECQNLKSLEFSGLVWTIGTGITKGCNNLTSITAPYDFLKNYNFLDGKGIRAGSRLVMATNLLTTIPSNVTSIDPYAYSNLTGFTQLAGLNITVVGNNAFNGCTKLSHISLPACTAIGDAAFSGCNSLIQTNLPACTSVGNSAFINCTSLTAIQLPECTSIEKNAFNSCDSIKSLSAPKCKTIGEEAFKLAKIAQETLSFPAVSSVGADAFSQFTGNTVQFGESLSSVGAWSFNGSNVKHVQLDCKTGISIGVRAFSSSDSLTSVTSKSSIVSLDDAAFSGCSNLTAIPPLSPSVTIIPDHAFSYCSKLNPPVIWTNISSVEEYAFSNSKKAGSINVQSAGLFRYAFQSTLIHAITLDGSVNNILNSGVFKKCTNLRSVSFGETDFPEQIDDECFFQTGLMAVQFTRNAQYIGDSAFRECAQLTSIEFGKNLNNFYDSALAYDSSLSVISVDIDNTTYSSTSLRDTQPDNTYMTDYSGTVLYYAANGFDVNSMNGITDIKPYAFTTLTGITNWTIPPDLTAGIEDIVLPEQLTSITVDPENPKYETYCGCVVRVEDDGTRTLVKAIPDPADPTRLITIPNIIQNVDSGALRGYSVETIDIRANTCLSSILSDRAFADNINLSSLQLPKTISEFGKNTFHDLPESLSCLDLSETSISGLGHSDMFSPGANPKLTVILPSTISCNGISIDAFMTNSSLSTYVDTVMIDLPMDQIKSLRDYPWHVAHVTCTPFWTYKLDLANGVSKASFTDCNGLAYYNTTGYGPALDLFVVDDAKSISSACAYVTLTNDWTYRTTMHGLNEDLIYVYDMEGQVHDPEFITHCSDVKEMTFNSLATVGYDTQQTVSLCNLIDMSSLTSLTFRTTSELYDYCPLFKHSKYSLDGTDIPHGLGNNLKRITAINTTDAEYDIYSTEDTVVKIDPENDYKLTLVQGTNTTKIAKEVRAIGEYAFAGCTFREFTVPKTITTMLSGAFAWCRDLTNVDMSGYKGNIPASCFIGCESLSNANEMLTCMDGEVSSYRNVGAYSFKGCNGISSLVLPGYLGNCRGTFEDCHNLTSVHFGKDWTNHGSYDGTFANNYSLIEINCAYDLTGMCIGYWSFGNCRSLTSIDELLQHVDSIDCYAFDECVGLSDITIPMNVGRIDEYAFWPMDNGQLSLHFANRTKAQVREDFANIVSRFSSLGYLGNLIASDGPLS